MKGTEKQIAWAEDIRKDYEDSIKDSIEYFEAVKEAGSFRKVDAPMLLADFVEMVKAYAEHDMMDSDIYKAYHEAASREEKKAARPAYMAAVADKCIERVSAASAKILSHDEASYYIDNRRILLTLTESDAE